MSKFTPEVEVKEAEVVDTEKNSNVENETDINVEADVNAETVIEDLENAEIKPENETEKKIVEEEISGDTTQENTVEKVTEIMAVETQEEAKQENQFFRQVWS